MSLPPGVMVCVCAAMLVFMVPRVACAQRPTDLINRDRICQLVPQAAEVTCNVDSELLVLSRRDCSCEGRADAVMQRADAEHVIAALVQVLRVGCSSQIHRRCRSLTLRSRRRPAPTPVPISELRLSPPPLLRGEVVSHFRPPLRGELRLSPPPPPPWWEASEDQAPEPPEQANSLPVQAKDNERPRAIAVPMSEPREPPAGPGNRDLRVAFVGHGTWRPTYPDREAWAGGLSLGMTIRLRGPFLLWLDFLFEWGSTVIVIRPMDNRQPLQEVPANFYSNRGGVGAGIRVLGASPLTRSVVTLDVGPLLHLSYEELGRGRMSTDPAEHLSLAAVLRLDLSYSFAMDQRVSPSFASVFGLRLEAGHVFKSRTVFVHGDDSNQLEPHGELTGWFVSFGVIFGFDIAILRGSRR